MNLNIVANCNFKADFASRQSKTRIFDVLFRYCVIIFAYSVFQNFILPLEISETLVYNALVVNF